MGLKLGEMLVSRGLITREQLQDALLAQKQFGGKLGTNLVEMGLVTEDQISQLLSEQLGVPFVGPQALGSIPRDVIARIPREVAEKFRVVPLKLDRELHVCMADPQNFERLDELTFALGIRIRPYVVTEVSLNYALERYYSVRPEARYLSAARIGLFSAPSPDRAPSGAVPVLPIFDAPSAPITVIDELASVMTEEDAVRAVMRYFADVFPFAVLLAIGDGRATPVQMGQGARRWPAPGQLALPLDPQSLVGGVVARPQIVFRAEPNDPALLWLCQQLAIPPESLTLIPLVDGTRVPYVLLAQGRDEAYLREAARSIRKFLGKVSHALRIVALRNEIGAA